jgi:hypothetical protein
MTAHGICTTAARGMVEKYLRAALMLTRQIRQTGDIFFRNAERSAPQRLSISPDGGRGARVHQ